MTSVISHYKSVIISGKNRKREIFSFVGCAAVILTTCALYDMTHLFEQHPWVYSTCLGIEGGLTFFLFLITNCKNQSSSIKKDFDKCKNRCRKVLKKEVRSIILTCHSGDSAAKNIENRMNIFFEGENFDLFYNELGDVVDQLNEKDMLSIGTDHQTIMADRFSYCVKILQNAGFTHSENNLLNFWSGKKAQRRADFRNSKNRTSLSDSNIGTMRVFLVIANEIIKCHSKNTGFIYSSLLKGIFRISASQAFGNIDVFLSNDKKGMEAGLIVNNYFWDIELPILQRLRQEGKVKCIMIHRLSPDNHWLTPVDLNKTACQTLPLFRRYLYVHKNIGDKESGCLFTKKTKKKHLRRDQVKPVLTWGKLKRYAQKWRLKSQRKKIS